MKLAAVQYRPPKGRPDDARADLARWVTAAGEEGADLVVCPEMATTGYVWSGAEELRSHAEPAGGPTHRALGPLAHRHGMWVVCGYAEQADDGLYNAALVIDPTGRLVGSYRKVLLYETDECWARPGRERMLIEAEFGRVVPGICMDINDPGFIAYLTMHAPHVLAFCTNWVDQGEDPIGYWAGRLSGWSGWLVAANTWGVDEGVGFTGRSTIWGPGGVVHARAEAIGDALLLAEG